MGFKKIALTSLLAFGTAASLFASGEKMKFPQFKFRDEVDTDKKFEEVAGNMSMYTAIMKQYARYKKEWLKPSKKTNKGYYILSSATDDSKQVLTVSEAHGWGMVIMAYMAGEFAPGAKEYFDGMFYFYKDHKLPSSNLMNWAINSNEEDMADWFNADKNSATDGDLDIAYALLLADKQWGSDGAINYKNEAIALINDIKRLDMDTNKKLTKLGAWSGSADSTRPSDWMSGHMRAFADATNDNFWDGAAGQVYNTYNSFIGSNSSAGLISDFVDKGNVCGSDFLGEADDILKTNMFGKNACRVPFRFMSDYVTSGDTDAKAATKKFADFIVKATKGDGAKVAYGYNLDGTPVKTDMNSARFTAPFMAAALVDGANVDFVKSAWAELAKAHMTTSNKAFEDAIMLMSMLVATGNWWQPGDANTYLDPFTDIDKTGAILDHFGNEYGDGNAQNHIGAINGVAWGDETYGGKGGDTTYYHGGGYWYAYGAAGAAIKTLDGVEILAEADTVGINEMDPIVQQHMLGINYKITAGDKKQYGFASLETNFAADVKKEGDKVTSTARYVNLSNLKGITIKYRATGAVAVSISTKDNADAAANHVDTTADGSNPWWGKYVAKLPAQEMGYYTISKADLIPEAYSPFEKVVKADDNLSWEKSGAQNAKEITFTVGEDADRGADVDFQVHEIILNGIDYEADLGIKYRPAPIIKTVEMVAKNSFAPMVTPQGIKLSFNAAEATEAMATLYSIDGRQVATVRANTAKGLNTVNFTNDGLANGMYVVRLQVGNAVSTARVNLTK